MVEHLLRLFPRLRPASFHVTSPADRARNCVAWAAGIANFWWWPIGDPRGTHWPVNAPRVVTLAAFQDAFETLGYTDCQGDAFETGFEKIAIFADASGIPTHVAKQLPNQRWTSKLGRAEDIEHELRDLEGEVYGTVVRLMKRTSAPSFVPG